MARKEPFVYGSSGSSKKTSVDKIVDRQSMIAGTHPDPLPRGSKYAIFKDSGSKKGYH